MNIDQFARNIGATVREVGTGWVMERSGWELDFRGERQALPSGSSPLMILNGPCITGQGWIESEIREFARIVGAAVVFEREVRA